MVEVSKGESVVAVKDGKGIFFTESSMRFIVHLGLLGDVGKPSHATGASARRANENRASMLAVAKAGKVAAKNVQRLRTVNERKPNVNRDSRR